jgi:flagellin
MLSLINNLGSLVAQNNLNNTSNALNTSLQRLSSGLRINSGADDPAGLVISEEQRAQISGLSTAITNTSKATNVVQTAEGALNETNALLLQIRGLAVDAANSGANDSNTLAADQAQISNALSTITRIATSTQFGSNQLLDGSHAATATTGNTLYTAAASGTVGTGTYIATVSSAATAASLTAGSAAVTNGAAETLVVNNVGIAIATNSTENSQLNAINAVTAQTGVKAVDNGAGKIILYSTQFGTGHTISVSSSAGASSVTGLTTGATNVDGTSIAGTIAGQAASGNGNVLTATSGTASGLSITVAPDSTTTYTNATSNPFTSDAAGTTVTVNASKALIFQIGANSGQSASLSIQRTASDSIGQNVSSVFASLNVIDVTNVTNSAEVLKVVDKAIGDVSNLRGTLGAFQTNTLQATSTNLQASLQNTTAAESTIRDTNFASETANFTKSQVLEQAGTQVLKNANQLSQLVLTLLQ